MQGRSNDRSARAESDPYQVLSLKLRRTVFQAVARHAAAEQRQPSVFIRLLLEREVVQPLRPLQAGWAAGEYVTVPVRVRISTVTRLKSRADELHLKPSQLARELLEDHVLRSTQTRHVNPFASPLRRAG